jgi:hypothetical protein
MIRDILVPKELDIDEFSKLEQIWHSEEYENMSIILPENLSDVEAEQLFRFLLSVLPNELAFSLLADLAEGWNVSTSLLSELFSYGDTGCNVTICLRDNLNQELMSKCISSEDDNVKEHFLRKHGKPE